MISISSFNTIYGWITVKEEKNYIISLQFGKINTKKNNKKIIKIISNFFKNHNLKFNLSLLMEGTTIQKKIWHEIIKIPYGKTTSYGAIAEKLNTSPRYVGRVCSQNKHLIIVPCHRVIRSDGTLGGYTSIGGKNLKKRLLNFEKNNS